MTSAIHSALPREQRFRSIKRLFATRIGGRVEAGSFFRSMEFQRMPEQIATDMDVGPIALNKESFIAAIDRAPLESQPCDHVCPVICFRKRSIGSC